jgi:hypothetical protein
VTVVRSERDAAQRHRTSAAPAIGLLAALALMLAGLVVPAALQWHVHANAFAPLSADWRPRWGPGTLAAIVIAAAAAVWADGLAHRLSWRALLAGVFFAGLAWLVALATVDGRAGLAAQLDTKGYNEFLPTARSVGSISGLLHEFISRIPDGSVGHWPTHVAGHPPGAVLFFVLLVRVGLGGGLATGLVVTVLAATVPVAVLVTLRQLGAHVPARRVAALLTFGPIAIWSAVSVDAVLAACTAWAVCAAAAAAMTDVPVRRAGWAMLSGVLFGTALMLSYGLAVAGLLVVAVLVAARTLRPVPFAALGTAAVVALFAASGFRWWDALPVVHDRYYAGLARLRPASYWVWGDLAALCFCTGPLVGASLAAVARRARAVLRGPRPTRVVVTLSLAGTACIVLADASLLSKAEVERIWLPFAPWLLLGAALLPARWRRAALIGQVGFAVVVQSLLFTKW